MSKKSRNIIFLILLTSFLVIAPAMVMYCLGWRINWAQRRIIEPGMLYLKALPRSADVYIEGQPAKKTDLFFGSILVENLMPKTYTIEIKKDGYYSWKKTLDIEKRQVTEAKNIFLIPQSPSLLQISENIEKIFPFPDHKKLILLKNIEPKWSLDSIDTSNNFEKQLVSQDDLKLGALVNFLDLKISSDSKKAILKVSAKNKNFYFVLNLETDILTPLSFKTEPSQIFFNPESANKLFLLYQPDIKEIDMLTGNVSASLFSNIISMDISNNNIYILDKNGFVFKTDSALSKMEKINILPIQIKDKANYQLVALNGNAFIKENDSLYAFDKEIMSFNKISDAVKDFKLSPDAKQLLYFTNNQLFIYFIDKKTDQPHKKAGEKIELANSQSQIENAFWLNNFYVIFDNGEKITISETDERGGFNTVDIFKMDSPKILWLNNKLFILSNHTLLYSLNLLP